MIVTPLDKIGKRAAVAKLLRDSKIKRNQESLSELQRSILKEGLLAHCRTRPLDLACGLLTRVVSRFGRS